MKENNINPELEQVEKLKQIGNRLHNCRLEQGISLEEIANSTLIPHRILLAIEQGQMADLPEPFYTRALMLKFARAIRTHDIEQELISISSSSVQSTPESQKTSSRQFYLNFQLRSLHLYLLYIILVLVSVRGITALIQPPVVVNQELDTETSVVDHVNRHQPPLVTQNPTQSTPQLISQSTADSVIVGINLQDRCWLKVMVDGKVAFEGTLPKGTQRTWRGDEQITIRAGNAGGVVVTFNNGQKKILGAPGQVEEVTYTIN